MAEGDLFKKALAEANAVQPPAPAAVTPPPAVETAPVSAATLEPADIDLKKELAAEQLRRKQAEFNIHRLKEKIKVQTVPPATIAAEPELPSENEDNEDNEKKFRRIAREEATEAAFESYVMARATSPDEAEAMLWHYHNSIKPLGIPGEDFETVRLLANKKRYVQEHAEYQRSALAKTTKTSGATTGQKGKEPEAPDSVQLTEQELKFALRYKLTPEEALQAKKQT